MEKCNKFPPFLCRCVARTHNGRRPMTRHELATRAGLSVRQVVRLSRLKVWDGVPLKTVDRFSKACGVDLLAPSRQLDWLRRRAKVIWRGNESLYDRLLSVPKSH